MDHKNALVQMQQNLSVMLEKRKEQIRELVGDNIKTKRLIASALIAAAENPNVAQCDPRSIFRSVVQAAMLDIDLANGLGEGWLVPFKNQCTLMIGYRGWMRRAQAEGYVIHSGTVYEHDKFTFRQSPKEIEHTPSLKEDRGQFVGAYAIAYRDGILVDAAFAYAHEIEKTKINTPAWREWEDRQRRKLVISRLCKDLPYAQALTAKMIQVDGDSESGGRPDRDIDDLSDPLDLVAALPPAPDPGPQTKTQELLNKRNKKSPIGDAPKEQGDHDYGPPPMSDDELKALDGDLP